MRVATRSLYYRIQQQISKLSSDLNHINEKLSSGKNINRPSDDPLGLIKAMGLKSALSQVNQYTRNLNTGKSWLNQSESSINQVITLVERAQELTIEMSNDTQSAETRAQAAVEVGHLLDQAIELGNTEVGGSYIFAGYRTRIPPFSKDTGGVIETAQYDGDTNDFEITIGKSETLTIGKNGQTALMDSNLFDTLGNLKKALEDNNADGIRQQLTNLESVGNYLQNQIADVGAKASRLDRREEVLTHMNLDLTDRLSQVEDADFAKVVIELNEKELAYQAALQCAIKITGLSLLNYMD